MSCGKEISLTTAPFGKKAQHFKRKVMGFEKYLSFFECFGFGFGNQKMGKCNVAPRQAKKNSQKSTVFPAHKELRNGIS